MIKRQKLKRVKKEVIYAWRYLHPRYGIVVPMGHRKLKADKCADYKLIGLHFYGLIPKAFVGYDCDRRRFCVGDGTEPKRKFRAGWRWLEYWSCNESLYKLRIKR